MIRAHLSLFGGVDGVDRLTAQQLRLPRPQRRRCATGVGRRRRRSTVQQRRLFRQRVQLLRHVFPFRKKIQIIEIRFDILNYYLIIILNIAVGISYQ